MTMIKMSNSENLPMMARLNLLQISVNTDVLIVGISLTCSVARVFELSSMLKNASDANTIGPKTR